VPCSPETLRTNSDQMNCRSSENVASRPLFSYEEKSSARLEFARPSVVPTFPCLITRYLGIIELLVAELLQEEQHLSLLLNGTSVKITVARYLFLMRVRRRINDSASAINTERSKCALSDSAFCVDSCCSTI
jgi:hypothetical protein